MTTEMTTTIKTPHAQLLDVLTQTLSALEAKINPTPAAVTVAESSRATLDMISPTGVPVTLSITKDTDTQEIIAVMERADKIGTFFRGKGWAFASTAPALPSAQEMAAGPTFCGFPCSPTVDERGYPSWVLANGVQAMRHEKQGDVWYSVKVGEDKFQQVLRIPKGEKAPAVMGLK